MNLLPTILFFILAVIILLSSRPFMYWVLRWKTERRLRKFQTSLDDLHFSFEELAYFVSLPNRMPLLASARFEDIVCEPDFVSFLFPKLKGLKFYVRKNNEELLIAYIYVKHFRSPYFDTLVFKNKINDQQYHEMNEYILLEPSTQKAFLEEVYSRVKGQGDR
ncbi:MULTISPECIES: hypothetical protein [Bacillaceae]|uniref:DUF2726 domain-containing protein n=1 Tax=Evansella alkalicola TaxID=745819 RepID=A0ABS6JQZ8_9BACI|nr:MULTISPECIES: hypothetical protein [Bacillaceae]MBU9720979.1 hypothetical protein [Bacillus alkalicola]